MRRVELFELIRKDHDLGLSKRAICIKRGVGKKTVNQALASPIPPGRKCPVRKRSVMNHEVRAFIDGVLEKDKTAPRKQRHTARRIWQRVTEELGSTAAEVTVRAYVRERKRELSIGVQAFVPQHHPAGAQSEVDFYEAEVVIASEQVTAKIVTTRSEFSAGSLHVAYPAALQSAFFEAMILAFEFLGGVPTIVRFDNLRQAVARVMRGKRRVQQDKFITFRSHYLFDASFTSPGVQGAHEKGGVEGEVGRFRRRWLTPVPEFDTWEDFNDYLRACCIKDLDRKLDGQTHTVGELVSIEQSLLKPLPKERFDVSVVGEARVDDKSRICVRTNRYSVPASLVGRTISWKISPLSLEVWHAGRQVAVHDLLHTRAGESLHLDHYLDVMREKPGAMPGSLALHHARQKGKFPPSYDLLWTKLRDRSGEKQGTRQMVEVLLLLRTHRRSVVDQAILKALDTGTIDPGTIAYFARHIASGSEVDRQPDSVDVGELNRFDRPTPETIGYDQLLDVAVAR